MNDFMKVMTAGVTKRHKKMLGQMEHARFTNVARNDIKKLKTGSKRRR